MNPCYFPLFPQVLESLGLIGFPPRTLLEFTWEMCTSLITLDMAWTPLEGAGWGFFGIELVKTVISLGSNLPRAPWIAPFHLKNGKSMLSLKKTP